MSDDIDIKFNVIKKPKLWIFQIESNQEMSNEVGFMSMIISVLKMAESQGIDRDSILEAIEHNFDELDESVEYDFIPKPSGKAEA